jgi:hypothetical protein
MKYGVSRKGGGFAHMWTCKVKVAMWSVVWIRRDKNKPFIFIEFFVIFKTFSNQSTNNTSMAFWIESVISQTYELCFQFRKVLGRVE